MSEDDDVLPRVRVKTSYLLQGSPIDGVQTAATQVGIRIRDDRGRDLLIPWTSVGYVVYDPEEVDDEPF